MGTMLRAGVVGRDREARLHRVFVPKSDRRSCKENTYCRLPVRPTHLFEDGNGLARERYDMLLFPFHFICRDRPERVGQNQKSVPLPRWRSRRAGPTVSEMKPEGHGRPDRRRRGHGPVWCGDGLEQLSRTATAAFVDQGRGAAWRRSSGAYACRIYGMDCPPESSRLA